MLKLQFTVISKPPHILYPLTILMTLALLVVDVASREKRANFTKLELLLTIVDFR